MNEQLSVREHMERISGDTSRAKERQRKRVNRSGRLRTKRQLDALRLLVTVHPLPAELHFNTARALERRGLARQDPEGLEFGRFFATDEGLAYLEDCEARGVVPVAT